MQALDLLRANGAFNPLDTIELQGSVDELLRKKFHIDAKFLREQSILPRSLFILATDTSDVYLRFSFKIMYTAPSTLIDTVSIKELRKVMNTLKNVQTETSGLTNSNKNLLSSKVEDLFESGTAEKQFSKNDPRSVEDHTEYELESYVKSDSDEDDILIMDRPKLDILETSSLRSNKRDLKEPGEMGNLNLLLNTSGGPSRSFRIKDSYKERNLRKIDFDNSGFESTPFLIANLAHSSNEYKDSRTVSRIGYTKFMELVHRKMEGHSDFGNLPEMLSFPLNYSPKVGLQEVATAIFIRCMLILYRKDVNSQYLDIIDSIVEEHGDLNNLIDDFSMVLKKDPQNYFPQGDDFKIYW